MATAGSTFTCPECSKDVPKSNANNHAARHWGSEFGFDERHLSKEGADRRDFVLKQAPKTEKG